MRIEFLYFDGCPSYRKAQKLLSEALKEARTQAHVEKKNIKDAELALAEKFLGSPSIRINGVDIDPLARDSSDYGLKCRIYKTGQGIRGWPSKEMIKLALSESLSGQ